MKRYISFFLAILLLTLALCGCESNANRATCTVSASSGFTGVYAAYECNSSYSSTYFAVNNPLTVEFDEPGTLKYKFSCPACNCLIEGSIEPPNSYFFRCDCEEYYPQAFVVRAVFSDSYIPKAQPSYEKAP